MSNRDRYADLYLNFEDRQQWLAETFNAMTFREYREFVDYCFEELDLADQAKDGGEFRRVKGLLFALARREHEVAHFMVGIPDDQRLASKRTAQSYYALAKGFYPLEQIPAVEAAWEASQDRATRFGWPTVVFDIITPEKLFLDR